MKLTFISDTHTKHELIPLTDLPGGDIIIHSGDIMNSGYSYGDITDFCEWFSGLHQYTHKIFIAGNHDWGFQIRFKSDEQYLFDRLWNLK